MGERIVRKRVVLSALSVLVVLGALLAATASADTVYGPMSPTFVGPAATGCPSGCSLLSGPFVSGSTAPASSSSAVAASPTVPSTASSGPRSLPGASTPTLVGASQVQGGLNAAAAAAPMIPTLRCQPIGAGCDGINTSSGGAVGVTGLDSVDSGSLPTNPLGDLEPADQGLCAGNGDVVEDNNIGEMLVFNKALQRESGAISLDDVMGLTSRGWSSGGDPSCAYDPSNGGHWFITEIVSASSEASGGTFAGCFAGVAGACYEGIAVSQTSNPFGPYWVYYLSADYNPAEPGSPSLLNDFAKIATTRDAFLLFYDEFPLNSTITGFGGGLFNGAQEFAFDKTALETGQPVTMPDGTPNSNFNVARENMGTLATPDGTCAGITCWVAVIPAQPADAGQWDNNHGGTGFMFSGLDFVSFSGQAPSAGDNRVAAWDWTGLGNLDSPNCGTCSKLQFGGQLFTNTQPYDDPENSLGVGFLGAQKAGPIPLGDECGAAGLSAATHHTAVKSCPEGGIETNGDFMTQASQSQGQIWGAMTTEVNQEFNAGTETHEGAAYWVINTNSFDNTGQFTITNQGYVSAAHEDIEMPSIAGEGSGGNGGAIMDFTLSGNGGPTGADNGGFYPSSAFGRLTSTSPGLTSSTINVADLGQSPADGFSEYQGYPGPTRPRWGDYSEAVFMPGTDRLYFANNYIPYVNCTRKAFTLTIGTCGGTRDGFANWGTAVNYVTP